MNKIRNVGFSALISCLAGALASLNYAPHHLWWLSIAAIAVLFWNLNRNSWFVGLACVYSFWAGYFITGMSWVKEGMAIYSRVSPEKAVVITVFLGLAYAAFLTIPWLLYAWTQRHTWSRVLLFPLIWIIGEWWRYWLFDGLIWLVQGFGHHSTPLAGWVPIFGALGASFFAVLTSALLVLCLQLSSMRSKVAALAAMAIIWATGYLLKPFEWTEDMGYSIPLASIQTNRPVRFGGRTNIEERNHRWMVDLETASAEYWKPGILIWPEGAIKKNTDNIEPYFKKLADQAKATGTIFFSGGPFYPSLSGHAPSSNYPEPTHALELTDEQTDRPNVVFRGGSLSYNSIFGLGLAEGQYHKVHRAPLGEYSPLNGRLGKVIPWLNSTVPPRMFGDHDQPPLPFSYANQLFFASPSICYEIAFADLIRKTADKSNLLLNLSNDAWFNDTDELDQALEVARIRALEHQKPLVRSTNSGLTAVIDHRGKVVDTIPRQTFVAMTSEIRPRTGQTPYSRWGDMGIFTFSLLLTLVFNMSTLRGLFSRR